MDTLQIFQNTWGDYLNQLPLISICIPTYNSALFLAQALESIAAQTYKNIEVIISDNASTDNTPDIIQAYCNRYGWTFDPNETNIGAGNNFNKLINLATGEYIAIYHADDIYDPTIVERSVYAFQQSENIGLVGTMGIAINNINQILYSFEFPTCFKSNQSLLGFDDVLNGILSNNNYDILLITPSIMVRKECYRSLGIFKIHGKYNSAGDYEMWLRIANSYQVYIINEQLIHYRIHAGQGSETEIRQNIEINDIIIVMDDYIQKSSDPQLQRKYSKWRDKLLIRTALKQNAASLYDKSNTTLNNITEIKYLFPKLFLNLLNNVKLPVPFRYLRTLYQTLRK